MSYTPTTEEVRNSYASWSDAYPEFDCWLADIRKQERKAERERIIKLLEDTPATRTTWIDDGISVYALDKDDFIALIKGETE